MIVENLNIAKIRTIPKELPKEKVMVPEPIVKETKSNATRERVFAVSKENSTTNKENINLYIIVSVIFVISFLIGVISFKRSINEIKIKEEILNYDFFYENVEDKNIVTANMIYKNAGLILLYWVIGISVIGAPILIFVCIYKGISFAIVASSILYKYGVKLGYMMLIKNVFLQQILTDFVIVFLTVSSIKVMYRILFQKQELKNELIRHSIACVIGFITLFTAIGINCITILNNFT